ncbi:MAG: DUF190 domain-containing protein [Pseudodesulfovibrio sp.]
MEGYLVIFFTQQNRTHEGMPVARWIMEQARSLGVRGATVFTGREGFGHDGRSHTDNYFDLQDPPVQVTMALTAGECALLLARIRKERLKVFYTRSHIEFGFTSEG